MISESYCICIKKQSRCLVVQCFIFILCISYYIINSVRFETPSLCPYMNTFKLLTQRAILGHQLPSKPGQKFRLKPDLAPKEAVSLSSRATAKCGMLCISIFILIHNDNPKKGFSYSKYF